MYGGETAITSYNYPNDLLNQGDRRKDLQEIPNFGKYIW